MCKSLPQIAVEVTADDCVALVFDSRVVERFDANVARFVEYKGFHNESR